MNDQVRYSSYSHFQTVVPDIYRVTSGLDIDILNGIGF